MSPEEALSAIALVAAELREHLSRPSTIARLKIAASDRGISEAAIDLVLLRWRAMIARRESGEGPLSVRA